jgi:hypothetical protein
MGKSGNGVDLGKWLESVGRKKGIQWDLTPTDSNKSLMEEIVNSGTEAEVIYKEDIIGKEFIYLGYRSQDNEFNTVELILWDKKPFSYLTSSKVLIDRLMKLPLNDALKNGHLFKIKVVEKTGKNKRKYLDAEVSLL